MIFLAIEQDLLAAGGGLRIKMMTNRAHFPQQVVRCSIRPQHHFLWRPKVRAATSLLYRRSSTIALFENGSTSGGHRGRNQRRNQRRRNRRQLVRCVSDCGKIVFWICARYQYGGTDGIKQRGSSFERTCHRSWLAPENQFDVDKSGTFEGCLI